MESMAFDSDTRFVETPIDLCQDEMSRSAFWGVLAMEEYEKGWSERLDDVSPTLLSDTDIWYFEDEEDEAPIAELVIPLATPIYRSPPKPGVAITPTIAI